VTLIGPDGTMRRRMVDTAASRDSGPWEELLARALAVLPPYRAVPGGTVYHLRVDDQVALVAEHDLSGPLYDLVTAVLAIGEAPHLAACRPAGRGAPRLHFPGTGTTRVVLAARTAVRRGYRPVPVAKGCGAELEFWRALKPFDGSTSGSNRPVDRLGKVG